VLAPSLSWLASLASFVGGLLTLFVFRRGLPHVGWIIGYLLLLWLLVAIVTQVRQSLEAKGRRFVVTAADYTIQSLYHGVLLFVLPPYYASTTLTSINAPFLGLLAGLALLATVDPWYRTLVHPRAWLRYLFFLVSIFAALNVALPLVGVAPFGALVASAWVAVVALTPVVRRARAMPWGRALRGTVAVAVVVATLAALGRAWIPPVPLALAGSTIARDIDGWDPIGPISTSVSVAELREWGSIVAYTPVYGPSGLRQSIAHVWRHRGRVVDEVRLSPVLGGRREGFRTYSRKTGFPPDPVGRWSVDVMTGSGQLIGRVAFRVTP
jgi:hypothetical protein